MSGFWKGILVVVLGPLLVTIIGGLLVELLKPRDPGFSVAQQQAQASSSRNEGASVAPQFERLQGSQTLATNPLIGKWITGTSVGERSLEFFPGGHVVREQDAGPWHHWPDGKSETLKYRYNEKNGELTIEGQEVALVSVKDGNLVVSWGGKPAVYSNSRSASFGASISLFIRGVVVIIIALLLLGVAIFLLCLAVAAMPK